MKRLAALLLTAALSTGSAVWAADPVMAPIGPSVPAPVLKGQILVPADGTSTIPPARVPLRAAAEKYLHMPRLLQTATPASAETPAVMARPAPMAMPTYPVAADTVSMPGGCATPGGCETAAGCKTQTCLEKFQAWVCYKPSQIRLGCTPTPYHAPLVSQFNCPSACASSGPCAKAPTCSTGTCKSPCRGTAGGCLDAPVVTNPGFPGYRFAGAENPAVVPTGMVR